MTKIPSVEERVEEFYFRYVIQPLVGSEQLDGVAKEAVSFFREALTAERTALLPEFHDSIPAIDFYGWNEQTQSKIKEKVQAHFDELIKSTK